MITFGLKQLITIAAFVQFTTLLASAQDNESYSGYDSIVKELSSSSYSPVNNTKNSYEIIKFHVGVGVITSRLSMELPKGLPESKTLRGFEARFGIDLFSPRWVAEGAVRTFDPEPMMNAEISMREFDLLVIYNATIQNPIFFNLGGGMSARYLDITGPSTAEFNRSNTTPAFVFTSGIGANITSGMSLGAQVSYRNPLVEDTVDGGSLDGGFRIAGRF